jgi:hypothetical protein
MNARRRFALSLILILGVAIPTTWAALHTPMPSPTTTTTAPPVTTYIPAGMRDVSWSHPGPLPSGTTHIIMSSSNLVVIEKVRAIINSLPRRHLAPGTVCPMNYMIPEIIAFSPTVGGQPAISVSFELGGCAAATVTSGVGSGARLIATLAGPQLASDLTRIEQLIHPGPPPVF